MSLGRTSIGWVILFIYGERCVNALLVRALVISIYIHSLEFFVCAWASKLDDILAYLVDTWWFCRIHVILNSNNPGTVLGWVNTHMDFITPIYYNLSPSPSTSPSPNPITLKEPPQPPRHLPIQRVLTRHSHPRIWHNIPTTLPSLKIFASNSPQRRPSPFGLVI